MTTKLTLSAPIMAHGISITELELRDPTTEDAIEVGEMPYSTDGSGRIKPLPTVAAKYLALMAAVPPSSVKQLPLVDFNTAAWIVADFFWKPAAAK